jgi:hypothetical protein
MLLCFAIRSGFDMVSGAFWLISARGGMVKSQADFLAGDQLISDQILLQNTDCRPPLPHLPGKIRHGWT